MKFASTVVSLFFTASVVEAGISKVYDQVKIRQDFMRAMNTKPQMAKAGRLTKAQKLEKLNESLKKASRKLQNQYSGQYAGQGYNTDGNKDGEQQQQQQGQNYYYQQQEQEMLFDEYGNVYYAGNDGLYYDANGDVVEPNEYGLYPWQMDNEFFDMSAKAFKYSGCAAIKTYDVDRAYENGNPMVVDTYATFRLCPANKCNPYSISGCGANYGEYAVDMKTYLMYLLEFYDERYSQFCEYCMPCDYDVQSGANFELQNCKAFENNNNFSAMQQMKARAYEDYVAMNGGGDNAGNTFNGDYSAYNNGQGFDGYNGKYYNGANSNAQFNGQNANGGYAAQGQGQGGVYYVNNPNYYLNQDEAVYGNNQEDQDEDYNEQYAQEQAQQYEQDYNDQQQDAQDYNYDADADAEVDEYGNYNGGRRRAEVQYTTNYEYNYDSNIVQMCQTNLQQMQQYYNNLANQDGYQYGNQYMDQNGNMYQNYQDGNAQQQNNADYYDEDGQQNGSQYIDENGQFKFSNAQMAYYFDTLTCCVDGSLCDPCEFAVEQAYGHCDDYVCGDYYSSCTSEFYGQVNNGFEIADYLECAEYQTENGELYYVGPHCGDDHYTISLGVFSDENCVDYIGNDVSLKSITGGDFSDSDLLKFPKECISCDGVVYTDENGDQQLQEQEASQGVYGDYYAAPTTDEDGNIAMCSTLYEISAQCNVNMNNYQQVSQIYTEEEKAQELQVCTFIENIMGGSYDESGDIQLRADTFDIRDWRNTSQYKRLRMPFSQALGLSFSIILCIALAAVAFVTQREFKRGGNPWKTKLAPPTKDGDYVAPSVHMT